MHVRWARSVPCLLAAAVLVAPTLVVVPGRADATHGVTIAGSGTQQSPYIYQGVPASITAGDTMTWLNPTTVNHTMTPTTSPDPRFRSHDLDGQGSYHEYRFTVPGSYAFQCQVHPATMHATFSVLAAPPPTPTPRPAPSPPPTAVPAPRPAPTATPNQRPTTPAPRPSASPAPTPAPAASAAPSPVATPAPTPTATASAVAGVETESATTSGDTLPTAPTPPLTSAPVDTGGPGLPVVLGLLAAVVALLGGALWLRRHA
jgi:plastocyanin